MKKILFWIHEQWWCLLNLLYPLFCAACGKRLFREFEVLCLTCETSLSKTNYHLIEDNPLVLKFRGRCRIEHASALYFFEKKGAVQKLLFHLKYKGNEEVGEHLGTLMGEQLQTSAMARVDWVLPVPLHPQKEKIRGYNQVDRFASTLAKALRLPYSKQYLIRHHNNSSQTSKNRKQRWENVQEIFGVREPENLHGKKVLLVDDVITTGATIEACCQALTQAGVTEINVVTIAVATHH